MGVQRVLYGEAGQSLRHVPPERVSSATYQIEDLEYDAEDAGRILASGSATVDSLSLTTDAAAGDGENDPTQISAASTTGATAGNPAVIVAADGSFELFEIAAVTTDNHIHTRHPLIGLYPSGSSVLGIELSASVPASVYDEEEYVEMEEGLRVVWEYTIGGRVKKAQQQVRVVYQDEADVELGEIDILIRKHYPDIVDRVEDARQIRAWVSIARQRIYGMFRARNQRPEQILGGDELNFAILYLSMKIAAENGVAPRGQDSPETFREQMHMEYRAIVGRYLTGKMGAETLDLDRISNSSPGGAARGLRGKFRAW